MTLEEKLKEINDAWKVFNAVMAKYPNAFGLFDAGGEIRLSLDLGIIDKTDELKTKT